MTTARRSSGRPPSWSGPGRALRDQWADEARAAKPCPAGCGHTVGWHGRRPLFEQVDEQAKRCVTCSAIYGRAAFTASTDHAAYFDALETCQSDHQPRDLICKHPGCTCVQPA
jgi:hypothetical protein